MVTIDLKESADISEVVVGTYQAPKSWIFGVTQFNVAISEDGKSFKQIFNEKYRILGQDAQDNIIVDMKANFKAEKARFVKITLKPVQSIPSWHPGKGKSAFLFLDEIIIN